MEQLPKQGEIEFSEQETIPVEEPKQSISQSLTEEQWKELNEKDPDENKYGRW